MSKLHVAAAAVSAIALLAASGAQAKVQTFTASGTGGDGPESATAVITSAPGTITIKLTSNDYDPGQGDGQEVSGIILDLSIAPTSATLGSDSGQLININGDGSVTDVGPDGTPPLDFAHWGAALQGSTICLETVSGSPGCAPGHQPTDMIIGSLTSYSDPNPSITGKNPQIQGTGIFVIDIPVGFTPDITGVTFNFGTGPSSLPGSTVPEPATWAMMLLGVFGLGGLLRRRRESLSPA